MAGPAAAQDSCRCFLRLMDPFPPSALPTLRIKGEVHVLSAIGPAHQHCRQQTTEKGDIEICGFSVLVLVARHRRIPHDSVGFIAYLEPN